MNNPSTSKRPRLSSAGMESNIARHVSQFLDLHAAVDHDENSESDYETEEQDFILNDLDDGSADEQSFRDLREFSFEQQHEELVRQTERLKKRYRSSGEDLNSFNDDPVQPSQAIFGPISDSINSHLWRVLVKPGFESASLSHLRRKRKDSNLLGVTWQIGPAFARPLIPGEIYVECESPEDIRRVFERVHTVYTDRAITLVPPEDHVQLLKLPTVRNPVAEGDWVRIKQGAYKGDIGFVIAVTDKVRLLLVPRINYNLDSDAAWTRAPPALFDVDQACAACGVDAVQIGNGELIFRRMKFKDGLLEQTYGRNQLAVKGVRPTFEEIELFSQSPGWDPSRTARKRWDADVAADALRIGDRVEITEGELKGVLGIITDKHDDSVHVQLYLDDENLDKSFKHELAITQVRKIFKIGDYVQVRYGIHVGKCGYVVKHTDDTLELVEWDKSKPDYKICDSNPQRHLAVYAHSVDFAQEQICLAKTQDKVAISSSTLMRRDPMFGTKVLVVKSVHFRGYRGTIQYTHRALEFFGVRLDAKGKIVELSEDNLVDRSNGMPIYYFRSRPAKLVPLCLPDLQEIPQPIISQSTPILESPLDSTMPAWDPFSHISDLDSAPSQRETSPAPCQDPLLQDDDPGALLPSDWLASETLHGKSVNVRISGFKFNLDSRRCIPEGCMAFTAGKPVSGEPLEIEVKLAIPGISPISVPIHFLKPVRPRGPKENVVIIAGEHLGMEAVVLDTTGPLWKLKLADSSQAGNTLITASPDHLVVRSRVRWPR